MFRVKEVKLSHTIYSDKNFMLCAFSEKKWGKYSTLPGFVNTYTFRLSRVGVFYISVRLAVDHTWVTNSNDLNVLLLSYF